MLGNQLGVLTQAVAGALDLDDYGVVQEPIEERGGDHRVAEDLAPLGKAPVGGEDHRAPRVSRVDQLEEQAAAIGDDRQVADLVPRVRLRRPEDRLCSGARRGRRSGSCRAAGPRAPLWPARR